jgi:protein-L-isoaspartate(D-aspartate) O-methyltransferase
MFISTVLFPLLSVFPNLSSRINNPFSVERESMIRQQLQRRGINTNSVLKAMETVQRERFVPVLYQDSAYDDGPLPIGYSQTISQPYIVAYMTEAANISPSDKVLEIGTGCGYQTAVLAEIAKEVYSIEIIPELAERASQTLKDLGYTNIHLRVGNGYQGWLESAPYDAIIVTAAPSHIPPPLLDQLAMNGKMVIPVGVNDQDIFIITKTAEGIIREMTIPVRFVPLR